MLKIQFFHLILGSVQDKHDVNNQKQSGDNVQLRKIFQTSFFFLLTF